MTEFYDGYETLCVPTSIGDFPVRRGGKGLPVLLLHGYPQTHVIFHKIAPLLDQHVTLIIPDLRGYGDAPKPPSDEAHLAYSKREMARDMAEIMSALGYERFAVAGHDRGGRVAHRLARDYAARVTHLTVMDIAPTLRMFDDTDQAFATAYYHWFFLSQKAPLPETLIGADPAYYLRTKLEAWSGEGEWLDEKAYLAYEAAFSQEDVIHASCEDYRAAASIDLVHDRDDHHHKLTMPVQAFWGKTGFVAKRYDVIAAWQEVAQSVTGCAVSGGHFVPEEAPEEAAAEMLRFWGYS